jgi:hypothetical protein
MTLTVFEPLSSGQCSPTVRKATWERSKDLDHLYNTVQQTKQVVALKPTLVVQDAAVPSSILAELIDEATSIHVPVVWPNGRTRVTLDVGSVGFAFFSNDRPADVLRLEWSVDFPADWEPVVAWFQRVRKLLEGRLTEKQDPLKRSQSNASHPLWDREVDAGTA